MSCNVGRKLFVNNFFYNFGYSGEYADWSIITNTTNLVLRIFNERSHNSNLIGIGKLKAGERGVYYVGQLCKTKR